MGDFDFLSMLPGIAGQPLGQQISGADQYGQLRSFSPNYNLGFGTPNIPGLGQVGNGLLGSLPIMLAPQFQQRGYTLGTLFNPMSSLHEAQMARSEFAQMQMAEGVARTQNESIIAARLRAMDTLTGGGVNSTPGNNADYTQQARRYNTFIQYASPFVNILDSMMGTDIGGLLSPTRNVGVNLTTASRGFYTGDGMFGFGEKEGHMYGRITADFINHFKYPGGTPGEGEIDYNRTFGLSMGTVSQAAISLQNRGLLGRYITSKEAASYEGGMREFLGVEGQGMNLENLTDKYNSKQIGKNTAPYLKVLAMAKELTGSKDSEELMKAIDALSGGGMSQLDPNRLTQMVAQTREIARTARMSMEVMSSLINEGVQMSKSMGMSGVMGARMATQSVLLANSAMQALGNAPGTTGPFAGKIDTQGVAQASLVMAASGGASSSMLNIYAAMHVASEVAGGAKNIYSTDQNGKRIVNRAVFGEDKLLADILQASFNGDQDKIQELSGQVIGAKGQARLANSLVSMSKGKITFESAYAMLFNREFSTMGQTAFDLGDFTTGAQRDEIVRLSTRSLGMSKDAIKQIEASGFITSESGLAALVNANIAPDEFTAQERVSKLFNSQTGGVLNPNDARSLVAVLRNNQSRIMQQQQINIPLNNFNAVLDASFNVADMRRAIEQTGEAGIKLLGQGAAELPGRVSAAVASIISGKDGGAIDALMGAVGLVPNHQIRERMQDTIFEAREVGQQIEAMKKAKAPQSQIDAAQSHLNRLTAQLSRIPSAFAVTSASRMADFSAASHDIAEKLLTNAYGTDAERNAAMRQKAAFDAVLKKGSFDWNTDVDAFNQHLEYQDANARKESNDSVEDGRKTVEEKRKFGISKLQEATLRLGRNPTSEAAARAVKEWTGYLQRIDSPDGADAKNGAGVAATDSVNGDKLATTVEVSKLPPMEIAVKGELTLDLTNEKALVDMKTFAETRLS
jgi:hypothetical protein